MGTVLDGFRDRARTKVSEAERYLEQDRYGESISASMEAMELAAKAAFLMLVEDYPKRHEFRDDEFQRLLDRVPEPARDADFPRLFFRYKLWQGFYTTAKYGEESLNVSPNQLFGTQEAELALTHARSWRSALIALEATSGG